MERILVYGMTQNRGGIESYLFNYFKCLAKRKKIIFDFVSEDLHIAYEDEIKAFGGRIYHIPTRRENLILHIKGIRDLLRKHREYKIVYFNILSASEVFTVLSAYKCGRVKIMVHSHNNYVKSIRRHLILRPLLNLFV